MYGIVMNGLLSNTFIPRNSNVLVKLIEITIHWCDSQRTLGCWIFDHTLLRSLCIPTLRVQDDSLWSHYGLTAKSEVNIKGVRIAGEVGLCRCGRGKMGWMHFLCWRWQQQWRRRRGRWGGAFKVRVSMSTPVGDLDPCCCCLCSYLLGCVVVCTGPSHAQLVFVLAHTCSGSFVCIKYKVSRHHN